MRSGPPQLHFKRSHRSAFSRTALRIADRGLSLFQAVGRRCAVRSLGPMLLTFLSLAHSTALQAEQVPVRHLEGITHGFLVLRTLEGQILANGDLTQNSNGDRVTSELEFRFKDGSIHKETAVFSQHRNFRLISDHLVETGPAFRHPIDVLVDGSSGKVTIRYTEDDGKEKVTNERMKLPEDVSNGLILTLLKNIPAQTPSMTVSMVAATPKPRLVKLKIVRQGEDPFSIAGSEHKAVHYVVKVEIGGVAGVVAPLVGKQPPDTHIWILGGTAPTFVRLEGPLYEGVPVWRIELISPTWPGESKEAPQTEKQN